MSDKAMIIILAVINFLIWFVAMDFIIAETSDKKNDNEH